MHPQQPAKLAKKTNRTLMIVLSTLLGVLLLCVGAAVVVGLTQGDDKPATANPPTSPAYRVVSQEDGKIVVEVGQMVTKDQMNTIATELRAKQTAERGYTVLINCSTGGTATVDNRLGNVRFGIGSLGKAQTGLNEGVIDVQVNEGRSCPA